jgi:hypothetical protein
MIPHVIVLEPGLVIFKIYDGYWFFGRPTVEELRQDLRAVLKKRRPDWDIARPELRAAWERGEHDRFYPYGKSYGQVFKEQIGASWSVAAKDSPCGRGQLRVACRKRDKRRRSARREQ